MKSLLQSMEKFNGDGDILNWISKLKMLRKVQNVKEEFYQIVPLLLEDNAYEFYAQLKSETQTDSDSLEAALKSAFGIDSFEAFERLRSRRWNEGESVYVYLANIRKYASACDIENDSFILHSFITGLPENAAKQLRTQVKMKNADIDDIVEKTRVILNEERSKSLVMSMTDVSRNERLRKCNNCGRLGHIMKNCRFHKVDVTCFRCGEKGHIAPKCTAHSPSYIKKCYRCGKEGHQASQCNTALMPENE